MNQTEKRPVYPIHPGTILADELQELNISAAELARQLHVPSNRIYQLISGKRAMTADTALRLDRREDQENSSPPVATPCRRFPAAGLGQYTGTICN
ncbi:MAG: HigA family addiction module antitoxin [Cyanobium sp. 49614_E6]|nr:HigA family addiction module antitoxin [Cyanobium sp. 49614_E6]